ncbi:Transposon TX1 uncharacterized 149 kDa protein [Stylophora pistillata]|uniref:Transposon TX1 uncharacterized 149 kDa protein n=1 Tax=Stylophora pistillata TaxID=50429 RepID=A0A2B4SEY8_STYPI|nr:Transposon TX1 uncharacterized 149 kDa protein [Stylophora pistillata]
MVLVCARTSVVHATAAVTVFPRPEVLKMLEKVIDFEKLSAVQFVPRGLIRLTFKDPDDKDSLVERGMLIINGDECIVTNSDRPHTLVYIHHYPAEGDDEILRGDFRHFGKVVFCKRQTFMGRPDLLTGSRILTMSLEKPIPAEVTIDGYPVRICGNVWGPTPPGASVVPPAADFPPISAGNAANPPGNAPIPSNTVESDIVTLNVDSFVDLSTSEIVITVPSETNIEINNGPNSVTNEPISRQSEASEVNSNSGQSTSQLISDSNSAVANITSGQSTSQLVNEISSNSGQSTSQVIKENISNSGQSTSEVINCQFSFLVKVFRVVCLYAPNRNPARDDFFDSLHTKIDPSIPTILAGDFNAVFDRSLDRRGSNPASTSRESSSALSHLFQSCCVTDIWRDTLVNLIQHLQQKVDAGATSCVGPLQSALSQLATLDSLAAKGAQVRSRIKRVEEGESSSAYFFRLEKKRSTDRLISALRDSDGSIVSSPCALCASVRSFYSCLFTASPTDPVIQSSLLCNLAATLSRDQASHCEGSLTSSEVLKALKGMARGKTPGLDGLPMEFYQKFWDVIGPDLVTVLNSCFLPGSLSLSQRGGVITLAFKKGDRLDARNWRPISVLNVDYKLAARTIAGRLLDVIHLIVNCDQTCGVPGRYIGENVALLKDVVTHAESSGTPIAVLSLDQEKTFDRVDWGFMRSTFLAMGFGPSFISWVDLFYNRFQSAVNVNGYLTSFFNLSRGVRQGCPLSPLLYVLVSEVLACNIRANPRICGLNLPNCPPASPISQYADDTSLILTSDDAIKAALEVYTLLEKASGSKLNITKSKGLWLGGWRGRSDPPRPL